MTKAKIRNKKLLWLVVIIAIIFIADLIFLKQPFKLSSLGLDSLTAAVSQSTAAINGRAVYYEKKASGDLIYNLKNATISLYGVSGVTAKTDDTGSYFLSGVPVGMSNQDILLLVSGGTLNGNPSTTTYVFKVKVPLSTTTIATSAVLDLRDNSSAVVDPGVRNRFSVFTALNPVVVNSASYSATNITKSTIVSIFGLKFGCTQSAPAIPLPTTLCGLQVAVDNTPVGLFAVYPEQINFVLPDTINPGNHTLELRFPATSGGLKLSFPFTTKDTGFGLFTNDSSGKGQGSIINHVYADYSNSGNYAVSGIRNSKIVSGDSGPLVRRKAYKPDVILLYGTGLGSFRGSGQPSPIVTLDDNSNLLLDTSYFHGAAPGFVGLDQLNVVIPKTLEIPPTAENKHTIKVCAGGVCSNSVDVYIK